MNTALPMISGTAALGETLTATTGSWSGSTIASYAFQWQRCDTVGNGCAAITGATAARYGLTAANVGFTLRVKVMAQNADGLGNATSSPTSVVAGASTPTPTSPPTISGSLQQGATLTGSTGSWSGSSTANYTYQWQRCDGNGNNCADITGANNARYTITNSDVGNTLRLRVTAQNSAGNGTALSAPTAKVAAAGTAPVNTATPLIQGTAREGTALTATTGSWSGSTGATYSYLWERCDAAGNQCGAISGATSQTYTPTSADINAQLRVLVTARNDLGVGTAVSAPTAQVTPSLASGTIRLSDGTLSVPASSVALPDRLVISDVKFNPVRLNSRNPFTLRIRITDTNHHAVHGAQAYIIGLPYGRIGTAPQLTTDQAGYATFSLTPTAKQPISKGSVIVFFVRANTPQGDLLAGASTRRLIQISFI